MDAREQRALVIAAVCRIDRANGSWMVPSQSAPDRKYQVRLDGSGSCNCPDCAENGNVCKHIRAVRITLKRELGMDGTVTETTQLLFEEKKTYKQNWPCYDRAQANEKHRLQVLLYDLCHGLPEPAHNGAGRKPHTVRDSVFSMVYKVYSLFSSRRFACDLADAHKAGYVSKKTPGTKVCKFLENPDYTPLLKRLIGISAAPLRTVEQDFAIDSSGFSTSRFIRWYDHKWGCERKMTSWVKAHVASGVKTNVVAAVRILDKDAGDSPQLKPLVQETSETFTINEVSADKAYSSLENFEEVAKCGGQAFIAFKENATGSIGGLFEKMLGYFKFRRDEFLQHYHRRSNVESTFSMVKRKFGDSVKSKTDTAMVNEVLCKFVAHNLCCLIQEQEELGIEPVFWQASNDQTTYEPLAARAASLQGK